MAFVLLLGFVLLLVGLTWSSFLCSRSAVYYCNLCMCLVTCGHSFTVCSFQVFLISFRVFLVFSSTESLALSDGCLGRGWLWRAWLGCGYGRLLGCSCYLVLGSAAPTPRFLGVQVLKRVQQVVYNALYICVVHVN